MELKDRLRKLRLSLKLQQKEMAARMDVPVCTYRSWEYGKKTPNKLTMPEVNRRISTLDEPRPVALGLETLVTLEHKKGIPVPIDMSGKNPFQ